MSWESEQIQSLRIVLRELQREVLVREMRRLSEAIEKQNELKEIELGLKPNNKTSK